MKLTFTSMTMPCSMVLVVALLLGNSASLKPATMMDPNMTAADELSNKMRNKKKLGSGSKNFCCDICPYNKIPFYCDYCYGLCGSKCC